MSRRNRKYKQSKRILKRTHRLKMKRSREMQRMTHQALHRLYAAARDDHPTVSLMHEHMSGFEAIINAVERYGK